MGVGDYDNWSLLMRIPSIQLLLFVYTPFIYKIVKKYPFQHGMILLINAILITLICNIHPAANIPQHFQIIFLSR